ncbi:hypothetical protein BT96DRAFT_950703 [Gymnopus androsaceus JB14]|uniref:Uncharacterized protein n=1 Tax=Gymnopus androsaceus JB14 TaxID=1447944 RepID=A0A6A4GF71_9AGAR|nr:hypothetical protein BT96DRAFT_950703 [Gymnopus androsaceus JB14]
MCLDLLFFLYYHYPFALDKPVICPWWEIGGSAVNYYDDWQATLPPSIHSKSPTQVKAYGLPGQDLPSRLRRSLRAQRTGRKTAIPMRMIVTRLTFIRCPTFTPVGETLALSPTLANFASVLPILPATILVLLPLHPRKQCTSPSCPISYSDAMLSLTSSREVVDDVPNASIQGTFYMTSWAEPEDLERYIFQWYGVSDRWAVTPYNTHIRRPHNSAKRKSLLYDTTTPSIGFIRYLWRNNILPPPPKRRFELSTAG